MCRTLSQQVASAQTVIKFLVLEAGIGASTSTICATEMTTVVTTATKTHKSVAPTVSLCSFS